MTIPEEFRAHSTPLHGADVEPAPHAVVTLDFVQP